MRSTTEISSAPRTASRVLGRPKRRREHEQHRVRERDCRAVLEPQDEQLAEHEARREEDERAARARGSAKCASVPGDEPATRDATRCAPAPGSPGFAFSSLGRGGRRARPSQARLGASSKCDCFLETRAVHLVALLDRTDERLDALRGGTGCPPCRAAPGTRPPAAAPCGRSGSRSSRRTRRRP